MSAYCGLPVSCVLSVPGRSLDLMDQGQGFRIASLDLAFPSVREDVTDAPDRSGSLDTTAYFSARAVTISGAIVASASGSRTASLALLAPYLDPAARPVLTYQLEADTAPRQMTLRAFTLSAPMDNPSVTVWSAQWKAPGGLAQGTVTHSQTIGASSLLIGGRTYDLAFNRVYPASSYPISTVVVPSGDYPTPPVFMIDGPITGAQIVVVDQTTGAMSSITLIPSYTVAAGNPVTIDCGARTIVDSLGNNVYGLALANFVTWPVLYPGHQNAISLNGTGVATSTQLVISWVDQWLI